MAMNQFIELVSPLGNDLLFKAMSGEESLGRLFEFRVDLLSPKSDIKGDMLLGQPMAIKLEQSDGNPRCFSGYVTRFSAGAYNGRHYTYQATLRPWLWILTRKTDCRIFQEMTVPEIIKKIFEGYPDLVAVDDKLCGEYRRWEYCVQYRESDFNFVSRLMEHEGIYYHFEHSESEHKLVLVDLFSTHKETPGFGSLPYYHESVRTRPGIEYIHSWHHSQEMRSGEVETWDYDFKTPPREVRAKKQNVKEPALSSAQVFDYPGGFLQIPDGEHYVGVRIEELQTGYESATASTNARTVKVGSLLNVTNHPAYKGQYLVTRASYQMTLGTHESTGEGATFGCSFSVIPSKQQYRPRRSTPKPIVQGPQTATVVGPDGDEIYTDQYGRVKVKFHWDRHKPKDDKEENRSCWIRVSHPWAGKKWGMVAIPRVLQEVIVDFLEGDPDQPIITGRVYNGDQMPPYDLPANKTQTGIKSRSSPGGDPQTFNEIRFEDKKGEEQVYIHAEKDMTTMVEHDDSTTVQNDQTLTVVRDQTIEIKRDQKMLVQRDRTTTVSQNETMVVTVDQSLQVDNNQTLKVGVNQTAEIGSNQNLTVGANQTIDVGANRDDAVGANHNMSVGGNQVFDVGGNQSFTVAGNITYTAAKIALTAGHIDIVPTGGSSLVVTSPSGPYQIMANKFEVMSNTDLNLFAIANINATSMGNNTTVLGPNNSGYIGMASDTNLGLARSTFMGLQMDTFLGVQIATTVAAQLETVVAAKLSMTAGPDLELKTIKMIIPGGGGGGGGGAVAAQAGPAWAVNLLKAGWAASGISALMGLGELKDQYKDAAQQLADAARDAAAAGHPGLAARLNRLSKLTEYTGLSDGERRDRGLTDPGAPETGDNITGTDVMNEGDQAFGLEGPSVPTTTNTGESTGPWADPAGGGTGGGAGGGTGGTGGAGGAGGAGGGGGGAGSGGGGAGAGGGTQGGSGSDSSGGGYGGGGGGGGAGGGGGGAGVGGGTQGGSGSDGSGGGYGGGGGGGGAGGGGGGAGVGGGTQGGSGSDGSGGGSGGGGGGGGAGGGGGGGGTGGGGGGGGAGGGGGTQGGGGAGGAGGAMPYG